MGASMGFFRMQDCRLALSIEEGGDEAAAAFPAPLLRGASPPWLLSRVTLHHWARGLGGGGRGVGAGSITVQDSDLFGAVFFT